MFPYIPFEIVDIIIEFADYKKLHKKNIQPVLKDIVDMGNIISENISPSIAYTCWNNFGWDKYIKAFNIT